ncbi:hypothetical protein IQ07DRAFT_515588, partial [Pyrenochaeta sp. DS3sAY3a]
PPSVSGLQISHSPFPRPNFEQQITIMSQMVPESLVSKYRYEVLFGAWLAVTGATFLRISRQPYSIGLKIEQYESIFKGTSLSALLVGMGITPGRRSARPTVSPQPWSDCSYTPQPVGQVFTFVAMSFLLRSLRIEFEIWNPLYALAPLMLLVVAIPLAIFATITTSLAVALLSLRAFVVYIQLALALIKAWISPPAKISPPKRRRKSGTASQRSSPTRSRNRRSSGSTIALQDTAAPITHSSRLHGKAGSFTALVSTSELTRDFEGVGGWRVSGNDNEEALWMGMNSRLELPGAQPSPRRHRRSLTGGATPSQPYPFAPEDLRMSPVQSRARTPVRFVLDDDFDYFPPQTTPKARKLSISSDASKHHTRRKSGSGSSTSSPSGIMIAVKKPDPGE